MPALPNIPQSLRVACTGTIASGDVWLSRFYLLYAGVAPTVAQLNTMAAAIATQWNTNIAPISDSDTALNGVEITDLSSPIAAQGFWTGSHVGTGFAATLPGDTCMVVAYEITRRYRGGHPRGYWRVGGESVLGNAGSWASSFVTTAQAAFVAFFTGVIGSGWSGAGAISHTSISYYHGFTVITNPVTGRARNVPKVKTAPDVDVVAAIACRAQLGSQRRRQRL